ncbi:uncharacterized protein LOC5569834 isoform X3 [Aedes aegypti]|uniref:Gustatory receptor n=1 Tax=Aedes aegypti TaxID=7159 RepID=A0A1S4FHY1_AEDAE|nr:gustatory receptor 20 isoform d [Aedes aegypti]
MRWITVNSIYDSVTPLYYPLKLSGLAAISFHSKCIAKWYHIAVPLIYLVGFLTFYACLAYISLNEIKFVKMFNSNILGISEALNMVLFLLVAMYSILVFCVNGGRIKSIFRLQHEIDLTLRKMNTEVNHVLVHIALSSVVLLLELTLVAMIFCYYYCFINYLQLDSFTTRKQYAYFAFMQLLLITMVYGTVMMFLPEQRFAALNNVFRMYFPTTPSCGGFLSTTSHTETVICNEKEQLAVLKQIKILHDKLNDVVELVNYCFSVQITFCVGLCFVIGVVCSFGLFRAFIYRNELFYMGVLNFVWYMYYLFFVLFFIAVGSKITREGKRIGVLVHKAINCASSSAVINELNIFSQQLLHRSPVITCGLFVYDWTLLYTMIGATATYLIILIQFDVSFPNLVNVNGTQTAASGV